MMSFDILNIMIFKSIVWHTNKEHQEKKLNLITSPYFARRLKPQKKQL